MTLVNQTTGASTRVWPLPQSTPTRWLALGQRRLDRVLETAAEIPSDDISKIVLVSDVHRGDKSDNDEIAPKGYEGTLLVPARKLRLFAYGSPQSFHNYVVY